MSDTLSNMARALSIGEQLTDEQKRGILRERARMLAKPISDASQQSKDTVRVLSFRIGAEIYAFPAASIYSVNKAIQITPVPCVPSFVAGVTNLRGHIRSVVRLAEFLGMEDFGSPDDEYIVVAQHDDMEVAFIVSGLDEVMDIPVEDIKPRPLTGSSRASQYIAGIVPGGLILLDLTAVFTDDRFIVNEEVI
jgi:purine-binding chemotaxis protein CheW